MPVQDPLYYVWWTMRRRCERPSRREAARYQGRGIKADMSPRPTGTQLDRIDNDGPYSPGNCQWASPMENANNTRQNRPIEMFGQTRNLNQWARELGINQTTIRKVLKRHPIAEEAILNHFGISRAVHDGTGSGSPPVMDRSLGRNVAGPLTKNARWLSFQPGVLRQFNNQPTG